MNQQEEIRRANEAKMITGSPLYQETLMIMRGQMMETFTKTKFDQTAEREEVWRMMKILDSFEKQFASIIKTGKLAIVEKVAMPE